MPGTPFVFVSSASKLSKWSTARTITARIKTGVCALHFLICLCIGSPMNVSVNGYHFATITVISETCDVLFGHLQGALTSRQYLFVLYEYSLFFLMVCPWLSNFSHPSTTATFGVISK